MVKPRVTREHLGVVSFYSRDGSVQHINQEIWMCKHPRTRCAGFGQTPAAAYEAWERELRQRWWQLWKPKRP
jgi:hypothetical protein